MEASDEFLVEAARNSPDGLAMGVILVVSILFVVVKWAMPMYAELRSKKLDIERYHIEVQEAADVALDERERERIRTTQRQISAQEEATRAVQSLASQTAAMNVQLEESRAHSRGIGEEVEKSSRTLEIISEQVGDIHSIVVSHKCCPQVVDQEEC